jgi:hypothetical protein
MQLQEDGTGSLQMFSGASDGEKWSISWKDDGPNQYAISLDTRTSISGQGAGLKQGDKYVAVLQKPTGHDYVLHMTRPGQSVDNPDIGFFFCSEAEQSRSGSLCGA